MAPVAPGGGRCPFQPEEETCFFEIPYRHPNTSWRKWCFRYVFWGPNTEAQEVFGCLGIMSYNPWKLRWLAGKSWKITIFNRKYIFKWRIFQPVMLVFGGGKWTPSPRKTYSIELVKGVLEKPLDQKKPRVGNDGDMYWGVGNWVFYISMATLRSPAKS